MPAVYHGINAAGSMSDEGGTFDIVEVCPVTVECTAVEVVCHGTGLDCTSTDRSATIVLIN